MPDGQLRVAQLNAGSLLEPGWAERRVEIVAWLERLEPDVVCLEEIYEDPSTHNTAGWIVDQMPGARWHWYFGGAPFGPDLWPDPELRFGSAILSRWPIERSEHVRLPVAPGATGVLAAVPWELVHVRTAGLDVFACHLAAAPQDGLHRQAQVLEIDRRVREIRDDLDALPAGIGGTRPAMPAILCGDFNAEPESDEIRFLSSLTALDGRTTFWQDAWRVAGDGAGLTQDWRTNPIAAAMNIHRKRIDYVFVGDPFGRAGSAGRVLGAEVVFDEPLTGVLASDHAGLVVDIRWPGRPPIGGAPE
jgi:endonuclease/exonuclease/phosphatase family metal-dependent hydrolase